MIRPAVDTMDQCPPLLVTHACAHTHTPKKMLKTEFGDSNYGKVLQWVSEDGCTRNHIPDGACEELGDATVGAQDF